MAYESFKELHHIELNAQQDLAVQALNGPVLLLAVPGSGKTTVLVSRLGYLICEAGVAPENILTVTYTVAATRDMKARFSEKFGEDLGNRLEFRTINGISQMVLSRFGKMTGKSPFSVVSGKEQSEIVRQVYRRVNENYPTEGDILSLMTSISYVKNMLLSREEISSLETDVENFPKIYQAYNQALKARELIDYDDQLVYAKKLLSASRELLDFYQRRFHYVCVDEAQDSSKVQHEILNLLAGGGNLFEVGDEDQSIYGYRAAFPEALVSFEKVHPGAQVLLMESNFRSCAEIVSSADAFIQKNQNRHEKHMSPMRPSGGIVKEIPLKSRKAQYSWLLKMAEDCQKDTAILFRNNESAIPLVDALERHNIPYRLKGRSDISWFTHPVVQDLLAFIRLSQNGLDEEAFLRIYYKTASGISKAAALAAVEYARRRDPGYLNLFDLVEEDENISRYTAGKCRELARNLRMIRKENTAQAIWRIRKDMGYDAYLEERQMSSQKADTLQILGQLEPDLASFPVRIGELEEIIRDGRDTQVPLVLSTIHGAKGLEWDRVYLLDVLSGILPSVEKPDYKKASPEEIDAYEEERRLFYVAMTRAKNELYLFSFEKKNLESPFTAEFRTILRRQASGLPPAGTAKAQKKVKKPTEKEAAEILDSIAEGVFIQHSSFGRGAVAARKKNTAEIEFEDGKRRKINLPSAVGNGLLRIEFTRERENLR